MFGKEVKVLFDSCIIVKVVDFQSGIFSDVQDLFGYDLLKVVKDLVLLDVLFVVEDIVLIKCCECYIMVYLVEIDGKFDILILLVCGYGLWLIFYGFLVFKGDFNMVVGFGFYQYGEIFGFGGEVDNLKWKVLWVGKIFYDVQGDFVVQIIKGLVDL